MTRGEWWQGQRRHVTCSHVVANIIDAPKHGLNFRSEEEVYGGKVQMVHALLSSSAHIAQYQQRAARSLRIG
jgi:hypothetical protein